MGYRVRKGQGGTNGKGEIIEYLGSIEQGNIFRGSLPHLWAIWVLFGTVVKIFEQTACINDSHACRL